LGLVVASFRVLKRWSKKTREKQRGTERRVRKRKRRRGAGTHMLALL
jgi:hypothetical protein